MTKKIVVLDPESSEPTWGDISEAWIFEVPDNLSAEEIEDKIQEMKRTPDWSTLND